MGIELPIKPSCGPEDGMAGQFFIACLPAPDPTPIFLSLVPHREPSPVRHDAFAVELAGLLVDDSQAT
jgi:hypothetical protein